MKAGAILKIQKVIIKNAPTILAVMGGVTTIIAVCMSSEASLKAHEAIKEAEEEAKGDDYELYSECKDLAKKGYSEAAIIKHLDIPEDKIDVVKSPLSTADRAWIYIKAYGPTAIMTTASLVCIFGSNHINKKRIASLAGAYLMSETALKEYKEKAKEIVGVKKAQDISDEIIQDKIKNNPPKSDVVANVDSPGMSNVVDLSLWYDVVSDRYFYSSADRIRRAELDAQKMLNKNGFVSINDVYAILGLRDIPIGNDIGWQKDRNTDVVLVIGGALDDSGQPIGTMDMDVHPSSAWLSEV